MAVALGCSSVAATKGRARSDPLQSLAREGHFEPLDGSQPKKKKIEFEKFTSRLMGPG